MTQMPEWASELYHNYNAGTYHQFLIEGNILDIDFAPVLNGEEKVEKVLPVKKIVVEVLRRLGISQIIYFSTSSGLRVSKENDFKENDFDVFISAQEEKDVSEREKKDFISLLKPKPKSADVLPGLSTIEKALLTNWTIKGSEKTASGTDSLPSDNRIRIAAIIDNLEKIAPESQAHDQSVRLYREMIQGWGLNPLIRYPLKHISILFTENSLFLPHDLRDKQSGICRITVPLPSFETRMRYFQRAKEDSADNSPLHEYLRESEDHASELASLTKGFRLVDCRILVDISKCKKPKTRAHFFEPDISDEACNPDTAESKILFYLADQKNDVISSSSRGLLEPMVASLSFDDIGGLDGSKEYFKKVAEAIRSDDKNMKKAIPKGVLLAGPPGTGKTILAKALAETTKLTLVKMGNIRSMWVGESEKNLSIVLNLLKAMAPVIVFVDEIDQALGARSTGSGDSGVSGRIFQQILEFMGDNKNRGDVIWIAATNRADLLDDAMISRFDRIIPVLLPGSKDEWRSVMNGIFHQLDITKGKDTLIDDFLDDSNYLKGLADHSGRSMETAIRFAYQNMLQDGRSKLTLEDLQRAFGRFKTNIDRNEFDFQTLLAVRACNDLNFITEPGDAGYSYGAKLDPVIERAIKEKSNAPLDDKVNELRSPQRV